MRFSYAAVVLSIFFTVAGIAATTGKSTKKSTARKTTSGTKKAGTAKTASAKSTTSSSAKSKSKGKTPKAPAVTWRSRQQSPTSDRYKEIQGALAAKGYLKSDPSGVWDSASVDAMQRFQSDQKLTPNGKINAPSLIGLGLGAKSAGASEAPPIAPAVTQPASPPPAEASPPKPSSANPPPADATHP